MLEWGAMEDEGCARDGGENLWIDAGVRITTGFFVTGVVELSGSAAAFRFGAVFLELEVAVVAADGLPAAFGLATAFGLDAGFGFAVAFGFAGEAFFFPFSVFFSGVGAKSESWPPYNPKIASERQGRAPQTLRQSRGHTSRCCSVQCAHTQGTAGQSMGSINYSVAPHPLPSPLPFSL